MHSLNIEKVRWSCDLKGFHIVVLILFLLTLWLLCNVRFLAFTDTHLPTHTGMARLSWPGINGYIQRYQYTLDSHDPHVLKLICAYSVWCAEAFRRLNIDPNRSPTSICTIPVNGDELQVQTEVMDVCITSSEVKWRRCHACYENFYWCFKKKFRTGILKFCT